VIVVTGGAGFIGARLVRSLTADGIEVAVVDDRTARGPGENLAGCDLAWHRGQGEFLAEIEADPHRALDGVAAVLHQGACSSTLEDDEDFLQRNNVEWSASLLRACDAEAVPLLYASSASVYGTSDRCIEDAGMEAPLNAYARSKARFDALVRSTAAHRRAQVVGLRYFNVYGPGERHKGPMASMALQLHDQIVATGSARIFGAGGGAGAGQHRRDFVHVDDVVAVVRWFLAHPDRSGIFNCGTGTSETFADLAGAVIGALGTGRVEHVPFPPALEGRYQPDTRADLTALRSAGCDVEFRSMADGVTDYVRHLQVGG
jgi:ADP-L-glycero-D-manno-heptose 6-epimerase